MHQGGIRLGRVLGVPLSVDFGVFLIGAFLTWNLATVVLPVSAPGRVDMTYWTVGALGAIGFLGSLLVHELAHCVIARRNGVGVEGITLWMLGGYAQFSSEPETPGAELRISGAGPAASLLLTALAAGAAFGLDAVGAPAIYVAVLAWLAVLNGLLGVFNLLPGAPLDGGRMLAAILWKIRGSRAAGRVGAALVGRVLSVVLMALGVVQILAGSFAGLWLIFVGWFLNTAARAEHQYFTGERALGDVTVGQAMTPAPQVVHTWSTVAALVTGPLSRAQSVVPVLDGHSALVGVVSMEDVRRVPVRHWNSYSVADLLVPDDDPLTAGPEERLVEVLQRAGGASDVVVVVRDGVVVGMVGPEELRRTMAGAHSGPPRYDGDAPQQHWESPAEMSGRSGIQSH